VDESQRLAELGPPAEDPHSSQWVVSRKDVRLRLDTFLHDRLPSVARRELAEWIAAGHVCINGHVSKKGVRLSLGDIVTVRTLHFLSPNYTLPVRVLHSDSSFLALDKPSGIPSIALRHDESDTVANFLHAHFPETAAASPRPLEAGVVHRLDTSTSGLLIAARTRRAYTALRAQFTEHRVEKFYMALVEGRLQQSGQRASFLAPEGVKGRRMQENTHGRGYYAETSYTPLERLSHHTVVQVSMITGVRHQIRVHLAAAGYPIVGDTLYGALPSARLCLHAQRLIFVHPLNGERMELTSPLPEDFLREWRRVDSRC
jgi:23S rRNA pseudouridine1911/1915/1917 synthase